MNKTLGLKRGQWLLDKQGNTWKLLDITLHKSMFNPKQETYTALLTLHNKKIYVQLDELQRKFVPVMSPLIGKVIQLERIYLSESSQESKE